MRRGYRRRGAAVNDRGGDCRERPSPAMIAAAGGRGRQRVVREGGIADAANRALN